MQLLIASISEASQESDLSYFALFVTVGENTLINSADKLK